LRNKFVAPYIYHFTILTQGIAESRLAELIQPWEKQLNSDIKLAYLPSPGIVKLRLSCIGNSENEVKELINNETEKLKRIISEYIFGYNNDTLEGIIGQILVSNGFTLSTAESCTGGKIAHIITTVPGCSAYYKGGIVAYSNDLKINLLQVNEGLLLKNGAVSKEVVESMAQNACRIFMSDFSVSTSGIAGPTGGSPSKPLGTTWIAVASRTGVHSEKFNFGDNRERNIIRATITALNMLRKSIIATK
jgi:nicotinamide-nucleotide amidase